MSSARIPRHRYMSLFITFALVMVFFLLLNNIQTVKISRIVDEPLPRGPESKIPGAYVKYDHPTPSNTSYCKFNYGLPNKLSYTNSDLSGSPELGNNSPYYVLYNVIEGSISDSKPGVTYATHITSDFAVYITEIVRYWEGPVSVSAYLPNGEALGILGQFLHFCHCIPEMSKVSLHLVFRTNTFMTTYHYTQLLQILVPPENCDVQSISRLSSGRTSSTADGNNTHPPDSWYPINICRNAAREAAYTKYVMVCDVELMPSEGLASKFIDMIERDKCVELTCDQKVYVLPIFEIEATEEVPRTKAQLVHLMKQDKVVYFHRLTCAHCQKFPGLEQWKASDPGDIVKPLLETKRESPYHRWEPIYIGTKLEPMYHEMLSWEGFQDKMLQMLEICLAGYKLVILDGAFLVHWPGIKKKKSKNTEPWRKPFMSKNQKYYNLLLRNLTTKYPPNYKCMVK